MRRCNGALRRANEAVRQIMLIESIIEMNATPCFFASEPYLSVKRVIRYGEGVSIWEGVCLYFSGCADRNTARWLKSITRSLVKAGPFPPSVSISQGPQLNNATTERGSEQNPGFMLSTCLRASGFRRSPIFIDTESLPAPTPWTFSLLRRSHPIREYRLGIISGLLQEGVCD